MERKSSAASGNRILLDSVDVEPSLVYGNGIAMHGDATLDVVLRAVREVYQVRLPRLWLVIPVEVPEHQRVEQVRVARRIVVGPSGVRPACPSYSAAQSPHD